MSDNRLNSEESPNNDGSEIDFLELAKKIWVGRIVIIKFLTVGILMGLFVAIFSPKEYRSESKLMPEYSSNSQSDASSLLQQYGGLLGISRDTYNSTSNAIRVDLYPEIVSSLNFQIKLAETKFYISSFDTTISLMTYYSEVKKPGLFNILIGYTIGLPGKILGLFRSSTNGTKINEAIADSSKFLTLTKAEFEVIRFLQSKVTANLDEDSGIVTVSAVLDDPILASLVTEHTINELTKYLIEYRTQKIRIDLEYIEAQLEKSKDRFETAQEELAAFREQFQGTLSIRNQTEQQRLNSEYQLAFNLYNSFSQKYEESRLKLQEETPLFKVLEPVKVPIDDEASGAKTLILCLLISAMLSMAWIFLLPLIESLKTRLS